MDTLTDATPETRRSASDAVLEVEHLTLGGVLTRFRDHPGTVDLIVEGNDDDKPERHYRLTASRSRPRRCGCSDTRSSCGR